MANPRSSTRSHRPRAATRSRPTSNSPRANRKAGRLGHLSVSPCLTVHATKNNKLRTAQSRKTNSLSLTSEFSENKAEKQSWIQLAEPTVSARLGSLSSECQADNCSLKLELLPSGNGISQGELLIILETEVPRIGTGGYHSNQRKQFIFYPGYYSKDEFSISDVANFEKRPFKFSKTLSASVNFKVTRLLRPLALNIYLFDSRKTLIHHERKVIDLDESYAN